MTSRAYPFRNIDSQTGDGPWSLAALSGSLDSEWLPPHRLRRAATENKQIITYTEQMDNLAWPQPHGEPCSQAAVLSKGEQAGGEGGSPLNRNRPIPKRQKTDIISGLTSMEKQFALNTRQQLQALGY